MWASPVLSSEGVAKVNAAESSSLSFFNEGRWAKVLEKMKPGDVSELFPINGQIMGQVRLYRPNGDQTNRIMTLQEATPMIDAILRDPKAQSRLGSYAEELKRKAVIDIRI